MMFDAAAAHDASWNADLRGWEPQPVWPPHLPLAVTHLPREVPECPRPNQAYAAATAWRGADGGLFRATRTLRQAHPREEAFDFDAALGRKLFDAIDAVRDALSTCNVSDGINLDIPQIVMIGAQSSGKSSVVMSLVGGDFIPTGSGITTRCPLVLKLVKTAPKTAVHGEFGHLPDQKFSTFDDIKKEIVKQTNVLAGPRDVNFVPISLTIRSPDVLDLTLVDLPGIVSNAQRDQPDDIVDRIKTMVTHFIQPKNTIILAVATALNDGVVNSSAFKLCREVDPNGDRTLGVLTMVDDMPAGSDAANILANQSFMLKHGWVAVVNRTEAQKKKGMSFLYARHAESAFFREHPAYRSLGSVTGVPQLATKLNGLLLSHIRYCLSELHERIDHLLEKTRQQKALFGVQCDNNALQLLQLIREYADRIDATVNAPINASNLNIDGGARLKFICYQDFVERVQNLPPVAISAETMRVAIYNAAGFQGTIFPLDAVVFDFTRKQIQRLENPALQCLQFTYQELRSLCVDCAKNLERFPALKAKVMQLTNEALRNYNQECSNRIKEWIEAEKLHINTHHPRIAAMRSQRQTCAEAATGWFQSEWYHLMAERARITETGQRIVFGQGSIDSNESAVVFPKSFEFKGNVSQAERVAHDVIRDTVNVYVALCKETLLDQTPKVINHLMIHKLTTNIGGILTKELCDKPQDPDHRALLKEAPGVAQQRKAVEDQMEALLAAKRALDNIDRDPH